MWEYKTNYISGRKFKYMRKNIIELIKVPFIFIGDKQSSFEDA
jgi:hypothetical protein